MSVRRMGIVCGCLGVGQEGRFGEGDRFKLMGRQAEVNGEGAASAGFGRGRAA